MNCKWTETILAVVILVFSFLESDLGFWVIIISAVLLLLHAWTCKNCGMCSTDVGIPLKKKKK